MLIVAMARTNQLQYN